MKQKVHNSIIISSSIFYFVGLIFFWSLSTDQRDLLADYYYIWANMKDCLIITSLYISIENNFLKGMIFFVLGIALMRLMFEIVNVIGFVPANGWDGFTRNLATLMLPVLASLFWVYFRRHKLWKA